ncbi:hypothetical protein Y1Q_0008222 [Alligator mississippiensis]|uniref:Uncharacterized protein n=1 Tax=Alligator mississippiensis TaxID=8496 RepID=A0A151N174_ALLMI|nr:hypothetical protein Y1Q_0008222 [Alligator mississippiensis]
MLMASRQPGEHLWQVRETKKISKTSLKTYVITLLAAIMWHSISFNQYIYGTEMHVKRKQTELGSRHFRKA